MSAISPDFRNRDFLPDHVRQTMAFYHPTLGAGGRIEVRFRPNNLRARNRLIRLATRMLRKAGYPIVLIQRMGIETNSHQCGTIRFGIDPTKSVLDPFSQSHDVPNLFVVDSSFFPSSAAVNPALTIAAQARRVADHVRGHIQTVTSANPNLNPVTTTKPQLLSKNSRRSAHS